MDAGDDPAVVAKTVVTAVTDKKPKLRPVGPRASHAATARRLVPAGTFDKQVRESNRLPA
jgi:hypothetical protein